MAKRSWRLLDSTGRTQTVSDLVVIEKAPLLPHHFSLLDCSQVTVTSHGGAAIVNLSHLSCIVMADHLYVLEHGLAGEFVEKVQLELSVAFIQKQGERWINLGTRSCEAGEERSLSFRFVALLVALDTVWKYFNTFVTGLVDSTNKFMQKARRASLSNMTDVKLDVVHVKIQLSSALLLARNISSLELGDVVAELSEDERAVLHSYLPLFARLQSVLKHAKKATVQGIEETLEVRVEDFSARQREVEIILTILVVFVTLVFNSTTGMFGMNVPNAKEGDRSAFNVILFTCTGVSVLLFVASFVAMKRCGLIGRVLKND